MANKTDSYVDLLGRRAEKWFAANATVCKTIESVLGVGLPAEWVGKAIILTRATTRDPETGLVVPCIRVRPEAPGVASKDDRGGPAADDRNAPPPGEPNR